MLQKGRQPNNISYKAEVLKAFPTAKWESQFIPGSAAGLNKRLGAIYFEGKRISQVYGVAWKAWEDVFAIHLATFLAKKYKVKYKV